MIPGDFSIVQVELEDSSDIIKTTSLSWGYDTLEAARAAIQAVSEEHEVPIEDMAVIRTWFTHDLFADD